MRKNGKKWRNIRMKSESKMGKYKNKNYVKFWVLMIKESWGNIRIF